MRKITILFLFFIAFCLNIFAQTNKSTINKNKELFHNTSNEQLRML